MFISVQALQKQEVTFDERFTPRTLDLGPEITQQGSFEVHGRADLVEEHEERKVIKDIRLRGEYAGHVRVQCARCLEPVERELKAEFDLLYRPLGVTPRPPDAAITRDETEIGFYQGDGVLLEQAVAEQVILAVPVRQLCNVECKGLCPSCGKNLNLEHCDCAKQSNDPRWAALGSLRDKLEH